MPPEADFATAFNILAKATEERFAKHEAALAALVAQRSVPPRPGGIQWEGLVRPLIVISLVGLVIYMLAQTLAVPEWLSTLLASLLTWLFKDRSDAHAAERITAAINTPAPGQINLGGS